MKMPGIERGSAEKIQESFHVVGSRAPRLGNPMLIMRLCGIVTSTITVACEFHTLLRSLEAVRIDI